MKKEIFCGACKIKHDKWFPSGNPYPGEYIKKVAGESLINCHCDNCNVDIDADDSCWAISTWTDERPYYEWEGNYINPITEEE